jgi:hypothetical protein
MDKAVVLLGKKNLKCLHHAHTACYRDSFLYFFYKRNRTILCVEKSSWNGS